MSIDYAAFRRELAAFAREACPPEIRAVVAAGQKITKREYQAWQQILNNRGWGAPSWPVEAGGTGWDIRQRLIFEEVMAENDCPPLYHHGLGHIGPVIIRFGTPEQKARFLPRILDGSDWWCQGYSEPGAGSDLASLQTSARRDGEDWVVNGQKIWTSHAHEASMIYMLVRTSKEAKKQEGISLLLVPMDTPGITVRPIRTIDGWHHLNEVFFDEVRVRADNLIGEEGKGWTCAKFLLERERLPPANVARLALMHRQVSALLQEAAQAAGARRDFGVLQHKLLLCEAELQGARVMMAQATDDLIHQRPLGVQPSAIKMTCADVAQRLTTIALDAVGPEAAHRFLAEEGSDELPAATWIQNYMFTRARTIAGGTSEVQRNVIANALLGADQASPAAAPLFPGMLFDAADRFAQDHVHSATLPGDPVRELGWTATLVPEADGGVGGTLADLASVVEGLAAQGLQLPVVEACAVVPLLLRAAPAEVAGPWLQAVAESEVQMAPLAALSVLPEDSSLRAVRSDGGFVLDGRVPGVDVTLPASHWLAVATLDGAPALFLVDAERIGAPAARYRTMEGRRAADFVLAAVALPATALIAQGEPLRAALAAAGDAALLLTLVDTVAAQAALIRHTLTHLQERRQFGVALATFQVLRHRVADMFVKAQCAQGLVMHAFHALDAGAPDLRRTLQLARLSIAETARAAAEAAIQMHGGMGLSEEVLATRLAQRLIASEFRYGDRLGQLAQLLHAADASAAGHPPSSSSSNTPAGSAR
ncbi:acyl-CoA dehydrogenase family protein [uncultured Pseudacidovorax sp.]|uniref:acyl-CoA dehydrogenase family protein n=1 Tax=uncultured Pseudacidovorax sp. TaxID=679313 RepID=UPI0025CD6C35|nr:acyl-CoA dehydrogenase family protein [uncultured Pseudacidovorax sp.]